MTSRIILAAVAAAIAASGPLAAEDPGTAVVAYDVAFYQLETAAFLGRPAAGGKSPLRTMIGQSEVQEFTSFMLAAKKIAARDATGPVGGKLPISALTQMKYVRDLDVTFDGEKPVVEPIEGMVQFGFGGDILPVSVSGGAIVSSIKIQAMGHVENIAFEQHGKKIDLPSMAGVRIDTFASIPAGGLCMIGFTAPQKPEVLYLLTIAARLETGSADADTKAPPTLSSCAWLLEHGKTDLARVKPKSADREIDAETAIKARETGKQRGLFFFPFIPGRASMFAASGQEAYPRSFDREEAGGQVLLDVIVGLMTHTFDLTFEKPHPDALPVEAPLNSKASILRLPLKSAPVKGTNMSVPSPQFSACAAAGSFKALPAEKNALFEMQDSSKKYIATLVVSVIPAP